MNAILRVLTRVSYDFCCSMGETRYLNGLTCSERTCGWGLYVRPHLRWVRGASSLLREEPAPPFGGLSGGGGCGRGERGGAWGGGRGGGGEGARRRGEERQKGREARAKKQNQIRARLLMVVLTQGVRLLMVVLTQGEH